MTERSVAHSHFTLERTYAARPGRVFAAWSSAEARQAWAAPGDGWVQSVDRFEFKVGGGEISRFGPQGGPEYLNETRYEDIVEGARIVSSGAMSTGGVRIFAGLLTLEFHVSGGGCRLVLTEQGVFLDGHDMAANHQAGWNAMLDKLGAVLAAETQAA